MNEITRSLEEIIARYELNPSFCDVYVEGSTDRGILLSFFEDCGYVETVVYDINTVLVPPSVVRELGLENNNRGRVIALARILYKRFGAALAVSGVIDADLDYVLGTVEECPLILLTDYTSMEMYFFNRKAMTKFARSVCPSAGIIANDLLAGITPALKKLFLARVANRTLKWRLKAVPIRRSSKIVNGTPYIDFDFNDYVKRYLSKNSYLNRKAEFVKTVREWQRRCENLDERRCMHGHDFLEVVALICSKIKAAAEVRSGNLVGGMLRCAISDADLRSEAMFRQLIERCSVE